MMKVRSIVVFLLAALCLSGCSLVPINLPSQPSVSQVPEKEIIDQVLAHLNEKYDVQFDIYSNYRWVNEKGRSMKMYVAGTSQQLNFDVEVGFEDSGGLDIHDGYVGLLMKPLLRQKFLDVVNQYYPIAEVQARNPGANRTFPDSMNTDTTLDEFLDVVSDQPGIVFADVYISLPEGETEEDSLVNITAMVEDLRPLFPAVSFSSAAFAGYSPDAYVESIEQDPWGARETNNDLYQWTNESFEYYWTSEDGMRKMK